MTQTERDWLVALKKAKKRLITQKEAASVRPGSIDSNNESQELAFSGVWAMPFGKGKHFGSSVSGVADKLASGWRLDYILTYISGFPVGLPNLINYCGNWANGSAQNEFHWFNNNPSCYAQFPANAGALSYLPPRFSGNANNPAAQLSR
jgi:hypothetical protein